MQKFKEHRVTELPTSGLKAGDKYHLLVEDEYFTTFIVSDSLKLIPQTVTQFAPQSASELFDSAPESDTDIFY